MSDKKIICKMLAPLMLILPFLNGCSIKSHEMNPGIKVHFNRLNVISNNLERISGIVPVLENTDLKCHEVHTFEADSIFSFAFLHNFEDHVEIKAEISTTKGSVKLFLSPHNFHSQKASDFLGILFDKLPDAKSIMIYNNGYGKEIKKLSETETPVDFLLVKYNDGNFGAFLPLSGKGYKASIGKYKNQFGFKAYHSRDGHNENDIPIAICAFGSDAKKLVKSVYDEPLAKASGKIPDLEF